MDMSYLSLITLLFVAAATPGPNNFIILGISMEKGWISTLLPIGAIITGTQLVLLMTTYGLALIVDEISGLRTALLLLGCLYLAVTGIKMMKSQLSFSRSSPIVTNIFGLFCFQLINPKSWILVGTAYTALITIKDTTSALNSSWILGVLILLVTLPCLLAWAIVGQLMNRWMSLKHSKRYVMPVLGFALFLSTLGLASIV